MAITAITEVANLTDQRVTVSDQELPRCTNHTFDVEPGQTVRVRELPRDPNPFCHAEVWIPWCASWEDFRSNHYVTVMVDRQRINYCIWQHADRDGDFVRLASDCRYHGTNDAREGMPAPHLPGDAATGGVRRLVVNADRTLRLVRV